jgi:hypothetical protein
MPAAGRYTWSLTLTQGDRTGLCARSGRFVIDNAPPPERTAEATPESTPAAESTPPAESTPESTPAAESTPESTPAADD